MRRASIVKQHVPFIGGSAIPLGLPGQFPSPALANVTAMQYGERRIVRYASPITAALPHSSIRARLSSPDGQVREPAAMQAMRIKPHALELEFRRLAHALSRPWRIEH